MLGSPPGILTCAEFSEFNQVSVQIVSHLIQLKNLCRHNQSGHIHIIEPSNNIVFNHEFFPPWHSATHDKNIIPYFYFFCKLCIHTSHFFIQKATNLVLLLFSTFLYNALLIHSVHSIIHFMIISTSTCFWFWSICY